ncbi:TIGR00266 family protein [Gilvimarinus polysaccharolyticus]|uniref:TIGR00266 family protein n=1 Tax=Gilvimarinus polysaccharolyticus TaxID=863921 RepID=UPI0006731D23|nr:TIGR00266 family protein [Gilvimarinus polysaccharolyticus]
MHTTYNVVITGKLAAGADKTAAINAFGALFKLSPEKSQSVFNKAPVAVKSNTDKTTAEKFYRAISKTGLECRVVDATAGDTPAVSQGQKDTPASSPAAPAATTDNDTPVTFKGFSYKIEGRPDYSFLTVEIPANETLKVEASAMATMDTHLVMKTKLKGGFGRFLTGESLFLNEFSAANGAAEIGIAPGTPGDLVHQHLDGQTLFLQNSAFVAATMDVNLDTKWQGMLKGFFSGESFFLIRASGKGDLWFNSYGAIIEIDVEDDYVVDTSNIVAFTEGLEYEITKVGGYKSLFLSGEGFVCRFKGKGKVWIQTRNAQAFTSWAHFFRPVKSKK